MTDLIAKIKKFKGSIFMEVGTRDCYIWVKVNKSDLMLQLARHPQAVGGIEIVDEYPNSLYLASKIR